MQVSITGDFWLGDLMVRHRRALLGILALYAVVLALLASELATGNSQLVIPTLVATGVFTFVARVILILTTPARKDGTASTEDNG
jgi:sugar phosphate permease